jgi:hypothetical protein
VVTRQGELWFGGENHDRMDLLPEKKRYQPGDTARLQVRMPFRAPRRWWRWSAKASSPPRWSS